MKFANSEVEVYIINTFIEEYDQIPYLPCIYFATKCYCSRTRYISF